MSLIDRLRSAVVVAVVRAPDSDSALAGIGALVAGGVRAIEVTCATPGADAVIKLFPGSLGGPSYLKGLREPFPDVPLMPTGGLSPGNVREWLDAGAFCVGAGGSLASTDLFRRGDLEEMTRRARSFMTAATPAPDPNP
jgi:2-dehydro-3-deoxyphosphogluconate aldolase/(4S)-4-hydroxy-2-oxoglutarate aldolase